MALIQLLEVIHMVRLVVWGLGWVEAIKMLINTVL